MCRPSLLLKAKAQERVTHEEKELSKALVGNPATSNQTRKSSVHFRLIFIKKTNEENRLVVLKTEPGVSNADIILPSLLI